MFTVNWTPVNLHFNRSAVRSAQYALYLPVNHVFQISKRQGARKNKPSTSGYLKTERYSNMDCLCVQQLSSNIARLLVNAVSVRNDCGIATTAAGFCYTTLFVLSERIHFVFQFIIKSCLLTRLQLKLLFVITLHFPIVLCIILLYFAIHICQISLKFAMLKFVSSLFSNSQITHIGVQRSLTFLYTLLVVYVKLAGCSAFITAVYCLSRNSTTLYRSGDARGAYRSTVGYEFKAAHLAFQRLRHALS